ncbi:MAG TPA: 1-acyl-sn-glycerol-3-phosphate acyltransferase [Polyangiaceae bacterium]|nr:1-acyl-sn-glycerol-3-phosphate acyltransferase [Polyangiaceae bacterium]
MTPLARQLARISAREMVLALGLRSGPQLLRRGLALPFYVASRGLGQTLATFEGEVASLGLPEAAAGALERCGVTLRVSGVEARAAGPCLVLANHPGAYDALSLMRAIGRRDLLILAADREFLRALPGLSAHLVFVGEAPSQRARALKRSLLWLRRGGALLHFPAGKIEPDADFALSSAPLLEPWQPGVSTLIKACERVAGRVFVAGVRGVHSPRAKRLLLNRLAEARGVTTLSPLVQLVGKLRDVDTRVHLEQIATARDEPSLRAALISAILRA